MPEQSIGIVECRGITASIEAADAMVKAADVEVVATQKIGSALIYIVISGKVAAVEAAVKAGRESAAIYGELYASGIIPRPTSEVMKIISIISK